MAYDEKLVERCHVIYIKYDNMDMKLSCFK